MLNFKDFIYQDLGVTHERVIVRAVLLDENNKIILEHLIRDDGFGESNYVETPGGGVNESETLENALIREIKEELGLESEIICPLEIVKDYYNLIHRCNINHYYLAKVIGKCESSLEELEKKIIVGTYVLDIDEAINKMENNAGDLGKLVRQRELPILKLAKSKIKELKLCLK